MERNEMKWDRRGGRKKEGKKMEGKFNDVGKWERGKKIGEGKKECKEVNGEKRDGR